MAFGDRDKALGAVKTMIEYLGEDLDREGLRETPDRIVRSWDRLFGGYHQNPSDLLTTFEDDNDEPHKQIILLKDIELYSTCEHHFLPFTGRVHVAYVPNQRIVGISKLARLVEVFSRRLQIQERIGNQVTKAIMDHLDAKGAACIIEAKHMCMTSRGVEKQHSTMTTSSLRGCFLANIQTRQELMTLIK